MPIYEFECGACRARFEELVEAGTEAMPCRECGAEGAPRIYSTVAESFKLVKTPGAARKQERANAQLQKDARERLKARRRAGGGDRGS